jgi:hypothetical protein
MQANIWRCPIREGFTTELEYCLPWFCNIIMFSSHSSNDFPLQVYIYII